MWKLNANGRQTLERLCGCYAPASCEVRVQRLLADYFENINISCDGDAIGNLYAHINPDAEHKIAIVAHADEVGFQISEITSQGLLKFRKLGGIRCTSLIGQKIVVMTSTGVVVGIVGSDPLQNNGTDNGITLKTSDLWIDIGANSEEEAFGKVSVGDYGVFEPDFGNLCDNRLYAKSFDDRLGIFVMYMAMKELAKQNLSIGVTALSSVQEEINMHGVAACYKNFDAAIILDVDFATDVPTDHPEMGVLELGRGVGININADSNIVLQNIFRDVMQKNELPYQSTLSRNISGGTDASKLHAGGDIATINVNLPLRYMHSRYEVCDVRDIECAVASVVSLVKHINDNSITNFVPWKNL